MVEVKWSGVAALLHLLVVTGCDRTPPEPAAPTPAIERPKAATPSEEITERPATPSTPAAACLVPLAEEPPREVASKSDCPADPEGRPNMPVAKLTFVDADTKPSISVEVALTIDHQMHGLMFRPTLGEGEGMLFSYTDERIRNFWMKNTCLALDMVFAARDGTVLGVLEQVPPWNTSERSVPCPAAHVLEVPAGWVRRHGVKPGQKFVVTMN